MSNEELARKLDENSKKIMENFKRIQQNTGALEILRGFKSDSNRWFIILIIVLCMWFLTIGYLVYVLNDTGTIEETSVTQENDSGYNNYIGNDGDINNG